MTLQGNITFLRGCAGCTLWYHFMEEYIYINLIYMALSYININNLYKMQSNKKPLIVTKLRDGGICPFLSDDRFVRFLACDWTVVAYPLLSLVET